MDAWTGLNSTCLGRSRKYETYLGSIISNSIESVTRFQTSYALVFLNSAIQSRLKSCTAFGLPVQSYDQHDIRVVNHPRHTRTIRDDQSIGLTFRHEICVLDT